MKRTTVDRKGKVLRVEDAEPDCGKDFCDACGDCLNCHGGAVCPETFDKKHIWILYKGKMGRTWVISDQHHGHKNIVRLCRRPFDHEERMLRGYRRIACGDTLICVGDFAHRAEPKYVVACWDAIHASRRILVCGNHDRNITLDLPWDEVYPETAQPVLIKGVLFAHRVAALDGVTSERRLFVHGHSHNHIGRFYRMGGDLVFNASVEVNRYRPVRLDALLRLAARRPEIF